MLRLRVSVSVQSKLSQVEVLGGIGRLPSKLATRVRFPSPAPRGPGRPADRGGQMTGDYGLAVAAVVLRAAHPSTTSASSIHAAR